MRILKVVQSYFPFQERGGPVFKVRALATGLARRGHRVTVLTADLGLGKGNGAHAGRSAAAGVWTARNDNRGKIAERGAGRLWTAFRGKGRWIKRRQALQADSKARLRNRRQVCLR